MLRDSGGEAAFVSASPESQREQKSQKGASAGDILPSVGQISHITPARDPTLLPFQWHLPIGLDVEQRISGPRRIAISGSRCRLDLESK